MSLLQQLMDYLSQPPNSTVYHIVTLLALQATLGLAWWQVRRRPDDVFARRLAWASGSILLSRLLILLVLFATSGLVEAIVLLPPLERAVDTLTAAVLVWALAPQPKRLPRLSSALLLIVLIVIGFLYVGFAGEWRNLVAVGPVDAGYAGTQQAVIWSIVQLALLAIGSLLVIHGRESQWSLRLSVLILLLVAQVLGLVFGRDYGLPNVEISAWARLGNVIAFPLLAILAYRHNLHILLPSSRLGHSAVDQLVQSLELSGSVSSSLQPTHTLEAALRMVSDMVPARFVAIVQSNHDRSQHLDITAATGNDPELTRESTRTVRQWHVRRDKASALSQALGSGQQMELLSDGQGARRFHELQQELRLELKGALLIQPLLADKRDTGLLILARGSSPAFWSEDEKRLVQALGALLGRFLYNAQRYQLALDGHAPEIDRKLVKLRTDLEHIAGQRDQALRRANQLSDQLSVAQERSEVDDRKLRETTQVLALAVQRQKKVQQLEEELAGLREALSEAELALAYAAASEAGLSTEWVMRTVTRYSGELEEAQAQINALESRLKQPDGQELLERAASITGRLRTPLTALGSYADLMLDQAAGELSTQQESLLRRMRVNVDKMAVTVDSLFATARSAPPVHGRDSLINVHEALDEAIYAISPELQSKKLRVDVYVDDELPSLEDPANSLNELLVKILSAACLVSAPDGRLYISARRISGDNQNENATGLAEFLRVSASDDGGARSHELYAGTILGRDPLTGDRSSAGIAELAQLLNSASLIASSCGGRSWLDLAHPKGSKLTVLLPFPAASPDLGD